MILHSEKSQSVITSAIEYKYIIECRSKTVELEVDESDVFQNADDEVDCPLDVVLRKNCYSLSDLMSWEARELRFEKITDQGNEIIKRIPLNVNL